MQIFKPQPSGDPAPPVPSIVDGEAFARAWESVQSRLADLPGEDGANRRAAEYAPFFLRFGARVFIAQGCRFYHPQRIALEDDVRFNENALVYGSGGVHVGRHARIGPRFFLHSANHEIAPSPLAFHERGYDYAQVIIGDNCLVSANVSILPGTTLGAGTFVAAGAIVTGRTYGEGARLVGTPAKELALPPAKQESPAAVEPSPAPAIVVIGRRDDRRLEALRRIVATLGVVQVSVRDAEAARAIEPSVKAVLRLDESILIPGGPHTTWSLAPQVAIDGAAATIALEGGERFALPLIRTVTTAPAVGAGSPVADAANITLYNALKRLRKRRREPADQLDVLVGLLLAARLPRSPAVDAARLRLSAILTTEEASAQSGVDAPLAAALRAIAAGQSLAPVTDAILARANASDAVRAKLVPKKNLDVAERTLAACPEILVAAACMDERSRSDIQATLARADAVLAATDKAWAIICVAAVAAIGGQRELLDRAMAKLVAPEFFDAAAACVRTIAKPTSGYAYSGGVGLMLAWNAASSDPSFRLELEREQSTRLHLGVVSDRGESPVSIVGRGAMVCTTSRRIASGMVDAWIDAVTPPAVVASAQLELTDEMYEPIAPALERAWRALFRHMLHAAGEPFVEILPWPEGKRAAVSIRYDIDRATQPGQVRKIVAIQRRAFGGPCASWYAIPGTDFGSRIEAVLQQHLQESGVHGVRADHAEVHGLGVTMHSAPRSEYWRGRVTLDGQANAGAAYAELLSASLDRPQPMWREAGGDADLWVTPLHFPLEGSTNDVDLTYFDRLVRPFRERIQRGGHAIIASHPDLNQELLSKLAGRESFADCWCAPIREVVERCRRLLGAGAVVVMRRAGDDRLLLSSRTTVADVAVRVEPVGRPATVTTIQLMAGQPRAIELA